MVSLKSLCSKGFLTRQKKIVFFFCCEANCFGYRKRKNVYLAFWCMPIFSLKYLKMKNPCPSLTQDFRAPLHNLKRYCTGCMQDCLVFIYLVLIAKRIL